MTGASTSPLRFHPLVWPLWLIAGALSTGSNPLHNLLLLLGAAFVAVLCHTESPVGRAFGLFIRVGLIVIVVRVLLSTVAVGGLYFGETLLGRLPEIHLPWWLGGLALGGPFTLEMVMNGLVGGIRLMTVLALFGAFNAVADHYGLLRRTPNFLGGAGLAVTIALAFVPQTIAQLLAIREAQRVRGHHFRVWRDTIPLLVPLIAGGLERSLQLAEAMDSRGYGARTRPAGRRALGEQLATVMGVGLLALGLFLLFYQPDRRLGLLGIAIGVLILTGVARSLSRAMHRSRYLRDRWRPYDLAVVASSLLLIAGTLYARRVAAGVFVYSAFPRATLPLFHPWSIGSVVLLIVPSAFVILHEERTDTAARSGAASMRR